MQMTSFPAKHFSLRAEGSHVNEEELHDSLNQFDEKVKVLRKQEIKKLKDEVQKLQEDKVDLLCLLGHIRIWVAAPNQESAQHIFNSTLRKIQERHGDD